MSVDSIKFSVGGDSGTTNSDVDDILAEQTFSVSGNEEFYITDYSLIVEDSQSEFVDHRGRISVDFLEPFTGVRLSGFTDTVQFVDDDQPAENVVTRNQINDHVQDIDVKIQIEFETTNTNSRNYSYSGMTAELKYREVSPQ
jgi:hypothetical protein